MYYQWIDGFQGAKMLVAKHHHEFDILARNVTDSYDLGKV